MSKTKQQLLQLSLRQIDERDSLTAKDFPKWVNILDSQMKD